MAQHRLYSMFYYGAAALIAAIMMVATSIMAAWLVIVPFVIAVVADRFINRDAEPDERLRSFVIYLVGGIAGLLMIFLLGSRLGSWTFLSPLLGFGLATLFDYYVPPAKYQPSDRHRYGASPPVNVR